MPIQADPNVPTVNGYYQVVSFHLLDRDGNKIDLEDATYFVTNITELDAFLSVEKDPNPTEDPEAERLPLSRARVLIKHTKENGSYTEWDEYVVNSESQTKSSKPHRAESWQSFAYNGELNPTPDKPCYSGYTKHTAFVYQKDPDTDYGLGDIIPEAKVVLDNSQDAALFSSSDPVSIPATIQTVEGNQDTCNLGAEVFSDFSMVAWEFDPSDYPKAQSSYPNPRVKLLCLAGYIEDSQGD